ncbi:MAG: metallophosphoesterase [Lachnospiraceae bacterium]|nr:metallophosphoesterase [Lachnospiraceae bacterium]
MYLYINSKLEISHYKFHSEKVRRDVRLAVLADLHNCMCEDGGRQLFNVIDGEKPDVIVFAGDMIDASFCDPAVMQAMKLMHEHYPLIYGIGNHERKLVEDRQSARVRKIFRKGLQDAGLRLLSDSYKYLSDSGIKISCLDLPVFYFRRFDQPQLDVRQIREKLGDIDNKYFNVLIAHDPQYFEAYSDYGPELVLSGHMHGGVVRIPFLGGLVSPKLKLFPDYTAGLFERKETKMIVSKGLGMHTIKVRVNNPTELVIVDITGNRNGK